VTWSRDGLRCRTTATPPSSLVHQSTIPPYVSTLVNQGRVSTLSGCVATTSSCCRSPPRLILFEGRVGTDADRAATQANEENAARSAPCPAREWRSDPWERSRLKIATDVVAMLRPSEAPARTGRSFSLARVEINDGRRETWSS